MTFCGRLAAWVLLSWCLVSALPAASQTDPADARQPDAGQSVDAIDAERLGAWLEYHAVQQKKERTFTGAISLVLGLASTGVGAALFVDESTSELARGGGLALLGLGALGSSVGLTKLAMKSSAEKRVREWRTLRTSGAEPDSERSGGILSQPAMDVRYVVSQKALARFEGEFRADAAHAMRLRLVTRWLNLGVALGGILVLGLTPPANLSKRGRSGAYAEGSILLGTGILNFAFSFVTTPPEKAWREYERGGTPSETEPGILGLAPWVGRRQAGLGFRGGF